MPTALQFMKEADKQYTLKLVTLQSMSNNKMQSDKNSNTYLKHPKMLVVFRLGQR